MPSTGRHSYFNISNSNYKSLIEPQRLVEITAWNRVQPTESAAIDQCWHQKINKLLKIANNTFNLTDKRGFRYPWVETGGTGIEQSNPCNENDAQWFRGLASHLNLPHTCRGVPLSSGGGRSNGSWRFGVTDVHWGLLTMTLGECCSRSWCWLWWMCESGL